MVWLLISQSFKNDGGAEMLVIGFPTLEGLFFVVPKS